MAYTLQAVVGRASVVRATCGDLPVVALAQDVIMIPLTTAVRSACGEIPFLPLTDEGRDTIPDPLKVLCSRLSAHGRVAYLEAEFFGGDGTQAMFLAEHGSVIAGPKVDPHAINEALQALGVRSDSHHDEFDAIDLGRHRGIDDWMPATT
jgi:hypothetical protein